MTIIHDPIHGGIELSAAELRLVDSPAMQRLRFIKQLGFAEMAFPGATHTRFAHSLGAMHMATRMVERVLATMPVPLPSQQRTCLRQLVRLAVLLHDVGHPPLSHASERAMPPIESLQLPARLAAITGEGRQANHEDYTLKLLIDSDLHELIVQGFADAGVTPWGVAALICGRHLNDEGEAAFYVGGHPGAGMTQTPRGVDLLPPLSQIVSSELDADRMDYLRRDAYACGVGYGQFDHNWLCHNLCCVEHDGQLVLALQHKAVWAFENFLLARYHMFLAVYYHHTPLCFDHLLQQAFKSHNFSWPSTSDAFLQMDDVYLWHYLRQAQDNWSHDIVARRPWRLLLQTQAYGKGPADDTLEDRLAEQHVAYFRTDSSGMLSKYFNRRTEGIALRVVERERGRVTAIDNYTPLYRRFEEGAWLTRIFCRPDHYERAVRCLR